MNAGAAQSITFPELDPTAEVGHLRRLLDIQPGCLLRLRDDGLVLAANDAALKLLGVESLSQALGRNFAGWIVAEQREQWLTFSEQVAKGTASSIECDLAGPPGGMRPMLFHAIPLMDHPDGIPSIAVSVRAVGDRRQLEAVIERLEGQIHQLEAEREAAQARLGQIQAESHQARLSQTGLEDRIQEIKSGYAAENEAARSQRDQALADLARTEATLAELRAQQQRLGEERATERERVLKMLQQVVSEHERELHEARSATDQGQLTLALEAREATIRQLEASSAEAGARLEQLQADRARLEAALGEREATSRQIDQFKAEADAKIAELQADRARLQAVLNERDAIIRRFEESKAATDQTIAELAADREHLAAALNDRDAAIRRIGESKARADAELALSQGARERLQAAIEERDVAVRRYEEIRSRSEAEVAQLLATRERLELALRDAGDRQQRLAASAAAECVRLQQLLDAETERNRDDRRLRDAETQERIEGLQTRLDDALRSVRESQETLREREAVAQESVAAYDAVIAERDRLLETAADQAVQLSATAERERHMMKLALIGRLARDIATQMRQQIEQVGAVASDVLHAIKIDESARPKLERLRGHAIQATALADDMLLVSSNPQGGENGPIPPANHSGSGS